MTEQEDRECIENIKIVAGLIHEEYSKIGEALDGQPLCESYMALKVMEQYAREEINDDPFMGSGTTAKMAILNDRHYIGFELSEEYCKIANERVRKAIEEKGASE